MSTKHTPRTVAASPTPGPWLRVPHPDKAGWIIKGATSEIGFLYLYGPATGGPAWDEANANARLLDAAPELLAALDALVRVTRQSGPELNAALDAIAKAVQS